MNIFSQSKPFIIAGPCAAEDEQQMQSIAHSFKDSSINMIRAGVWKPRSKPGFFEGRGEIALKWLQTVKEISGTQVCTEIATPEQIELALKYNLDAVWIGARTTVNPFVVQELADALKGCKMAVLVKNPINPDIELWSGAVERIQKAGIENIAAIHRGFSSYDSTSKYRNKPNWAIPIELKRRYKELPIFCDASHICGNIELIPSISQRALDLDFDGLMLETHPNPAAALSDAKQQLTPTALFDLISKLIIREPIDGSTQDEIEHIRQIIDSLDAEVVDLIGKRMDIVKSLAILKNKNNMPIYQVDRWCEIIESRTNWGKKNDLDAEFLLKLFELIHDKSIKTQIQIKN